MHLKSIEILNLWDKEPIRVPFENRVTFLTGINGSGKSTILNIIFDTLMANKSVPATSKNRFWSCKADFDNEFTCYTSLLPFPPTPEANNKKLEEYLDDASNKLHDISKLKEVESLYASSAEGNLKSVRYNEDLKGHLQQTGISFKDSLFEGKDDAVAAIPNVFIFQEDRKSLHNAEKIASIRSSGSFLFYKNSIDERFAYIREAFAIYESRTTAVLEDEILNASKNGETIEISNNAKIKSALQQISAKNSVIDRLNNYFKDTGKKISRDDDNRITLEVISSGTAVSWNLLSRGEKTLIYLFLVSLIYNGSIFLLDEPEISLHISWQENLISNLSEIANKSQFIVATHSPSMVSDGWLSNCLNLKI